MKSQSILPQSILFVCLGNICRSPLAEGIFRHLALDAGIESQLTIDSAGLGSWHAGDPPDPRGIRIAAESGVDISGQRARQVVAPDFHRFDLILGMDRSNVEALEGLRPPDSAADVALYLDHAQGRVADVPDPYYGGDADFHRAIALIREASADLVSKLSGSSPI